MNKLYEHNAVAFASTDIGFHYKIIGAAILLVFVALQVALIYFYVWPRLKAARAALGTNAKVAAATGLWAKTVARLIGIKTLIVGSVGSFFLVLPDLLTQLRLVDFSGTWLAAYQPYIALATIVLMLCTHAGGQKPAAEAVPVAGPNANVNAPVAGVTPPTS